MAKAEIHQIFYSEATRARLDPGFIGLDNLANERPDWREYWPIRRFLLGHTLKPDTYYGFFSSKFGAKTGLSSTAVHELIDRHGADADVITFSPYLEHIAVYLNIIEQAAACHGQIETFRECAAMVAPEFRIDRCVMTSLDTVFCNFFVAKPQFWSEWLGHAERLFEIAESGSTPLAQALNSVITYVVVEPNGTSAGSAAQPHVTLHPVPNVQTKVFVIERLASLLLWSNRRWRIKSFNHMTSSPGAPATPDHFVLDALKIAYAQTGAGPYLDTFSKLRRQITARHERSESPSRAGPIAAGAVPSPAAGTTPPAAPPENPGTTPEKIRIVCATRKSREQFVLDTELGQSLARLLPSNVELRLFPGNARGLPVIYNIAIDESRNDPAILLFVHDDVYLNDTFWADRLREAVNRFQIAGVAGNRRRAARQPSWCFSAIDPADGKLIRDDRENLSGAVTHGGGARPQRVDAFGPAGQSVKLLDGLFLAARSTTLWKESLRFDERFDFHFYDLDFCRQAERAGLGMGTWPISVTHASLGGFCGDAWRSGYERYVDKWSD